MKTTLVVMTLNEIEGMKRIMPTIPKDWCDQILVIDGGSTDGTIEWARENGYEIHVQERKGIRHGYFEALHKIRGDVLLTFSPDGNCPVEGIPLILEKMKEGYDMVIASRYLPPAKSDDDDWVTAFGNWLFITTARVLYGGKLTDVMGIFRAYRKSLITEFALDKEETYQLPEKLFTTTISWEPLLSVRALRAKKRLGEVPVDEPARIAGERKLQIWRWGAAYYFQFLTDRFVWKPKVAKLGVKTSES